MFRIGRMPPSGKSFFRPLQGFFHQPAWRHCWQLVLAITIGSTITIERLSGLIQDGPHRTNHGEFLWRSEWDEALVVQHAALAILRRLMRRRGRGHKLYVVFDDTQVSKRAKKMQGVGTLFDHVNQRWTAGHLILKATLWYDGVAIPWATWLYLKAELCQDVGVPFIKRTDLIVNAIGNADFPDDLQVVVLFDAFYLTKAIAKACETRGFTWISQAKRNRTFIPEGHGQRVRLESYADNLLRHHGLVRSVQGLRRRRKHRLAERIGFMKKLGKVKLVVNRCVDKRDIHLLVSNNTRWAGATLISDYLKRWSIEQLIKDQKQHLGLGDYRVLRYRSVVRHLHLVDLAYACLTHLGLDQAVDAQGHSHPTKNTVLRLPTISQLKIAMRRQTWRMAVEEVMKKSHERPVIKRLEKLLAAA
jgi:hypothetical protein